MENQNFLSILIFIFLCLIIFLLIYMVIKRQRQIENYRKQKLKTDVLLNTFLNQLDLHTIFNFLNMIGASLYQSSKDESYQMITEFARMLRGNLTFNIRLLKPLGEELEKLQNYLDLERERFEKKFEFDIVVDSPELYSVAVPRMLIYVFVENAVKHGIKHFDKQGKVRIKVGKRGDFIEIIVTDNGIGRQRAAEIGSKSNGYGKRIANAYLSICNSKKLKNLSIQVDDFIPVSENPGTMVTLLWNPNHQDLLKPL